MGATGKLLTAFTAPARRVVAGVGERGRPRTASSIAYAMRFADAVTRGDFAAAERVARVALAHSAEH